MEKSSIKRYDMKERKLNSSGVLLAMAIVSCLTGGFLASFIIAYLTNQWEVFAIGMGVSGFIFLFFYGVYIIEKHRPI